MSGPPGDLHRLPLPRRHVVVAAGLVAVLYLAGVTGSWWPTPDSALYQGLGRSLLHGQGYRFNGQVNTVGLDRSVTSSSRVSSQGIST